MFLKVLFYLFLIVMSLGNQITHTYDREALKLELYLSQYRLMLINLAEYNNLVDSQIKKAESELKAFQYCIKNNNDLCQNYFNSLRNFNGAFLQNYLKKDNLSDNLLDVCHKNLSTSIEEFKKSEEISDLDVQQELDKTTELVSQINNEYYKKLNLIKKFWVWQYSHLTR